MKNIFRHPSDINEPLTGMEITGMTFAAASYAVVQVMLSVFTVYYYTDVAGISSAVVGTLMLIIRVTDGFAGLGAGFAISKTRSRRGTARPWGLRLAFPMFILLIMVFCVPVHWSTATKTLYACVTFFFLNIAVLTPAGIAGSMLGTNMTVNPKSRGKNAMFSSLFTILGSVVGNVAILRFTQSGGDSYEAWRLAAVILGAFAFAGQAAQYLLTRERIAFTSHRESYPAPFPLKAQFKVLLKNKYFVIMCFTGMLTAVDGATAGSVIYYVKYILGNMDLIGIISAITLACMMAGIALTPAAAKKISAKSLILIGLAVKIVTFAINLYAPANLELFVGLSALRSLTGAPLTVYGSVYLLNTIEYGEYVTGIRTNHLIISVSGIWSKIGAGVGGALIGWLLSFGGYDGAAAAQSARAQNAICAIYLLIPLMAAAATFVLMALYDLDKKYDGILASMKASANNDMPGREAA